MMRSSSTERFAYPVARLDELEADIAAVLQTAIGDEMIRTIIVAPRQRQLVVRGGWRRRLFGLLSWQWTPAWVLALTEKQLLVVTRARPDASPTLHSIFPDTLLSVEVGVVLLMGWMICVWAEQDCVETLEVRFNTASDNFFWNIQRWLCAAAASTRLTPPERHLERLETLPYRFKHLIPRRLLLPDEGVEAVIFQEAIWRRRCWVLKRRITPSRVVILTGAHILVAADEEVAGGGASHGMIVRYFPRRHVRAITVTPADRGLRLTVSAACATAETTYALLLGQHHPGQIDDFLQKFSSLDNEAG